MSVAAISAVKRARAFLLALVSCVGAITTHCTPANAQETVHERLTKLAQDMVYVPLRRHPINATFLGITTYDADLETPSRAYRDEDLAMLRKWKAQLAEIAPPGANLSLVDRDDVKLLEGRLAEQINGLTVYRLDQKDYSAPAQAIINVVFVQFLHLPVEGHGAATAADVARAWDAIIARLEKAPRYIVAGQALVISPGHLYGLIGDEQLAGAPDFFKGALTDTAKAQLAPETFARFVKARDATLSTIEQTSAYIKAHVASWPENYAIGRDAYDRMLREEQLLPYNASDVEDLAAAELASGWATEAWLTSLAKERGTPFGAPTGGGMAPGGRPLIGYYRDRIADLRKFVVDHGVVTVPAWLGSIEVVETPPFMQPVSPGASMYAPRLLSDEKNGYYFITPPKSLEEAAKTLDMNQDFDRDRIWSTAAHEAMPGHFLQLSIAKRHPDFIRKTEQSGAFVEGWAFYLEEMFVRLGLFGDDLDARLFTARWERVRGARAVVDPKLATGEWNYQQASDFFAAQTGFTKDQADAAVAGIALYPGSVIAYTVGRLQLENLLAAYMAKAGPNASLHEFHDRLLSYGATPFAIVMPELLADLAKPVAEVRRQANW